MIERICWGLLAAIHAVPALAAFQPALLTRLYGVEQGESSFILLQHRAALFLVIVIVCGWAITSPRHRDTGVERAFSSASGMGARHRAISPSRRRLWWRHRVMSSKAFCVWLLEGQLSGIFPGQLLPRGPRPAVSTRAITSCVTRCVAAA